MEFLLDPNVSYLILVGGLLLAILALFAPGTGVIELGAMFALLLAGYGIYNIPINVWALVILLLGVFPFLIALRRWGYWPLLLISILALTFGSAYLFRGEAWWLPGVHPLLAVIVSAGSTVFLWLVGHKGLEAMARKPITVLDRLDGAIGKTETPVHLEGTVYVAGENWSAHSQKPIPADTNVRVVKREGFILEVEELPK